MLVSDLVKYFGSVSNAAKAINVTTHCIYNWTTRGIPVRRQMQFSKLSNGELVASLPEHDNNFVPYLSKKLGATPLTQEQVEELLETISNLRSEILKLQKNNS